MLCVCVRALVDVACLVLQLGFTSRITHARRSVRSASVKQLHCVRVRVCACAFVFAFVFVFVLAFAIVFVCVFACGVCVRVCFCVCVCVCVFVPWPC